MNQPKPTKPPAETDEITQQNQTIVTKNLGIKSCNTNVVLKGRHSVLQRWMHGG